MVLLLIFLLKSQAILTSFTAASVNTQVLGNQTGNYRDPRNGLLGIYFNPQDPLSRLAASWWAKYFERPLRPHLTVSLLPAPTTTVSPTTTTTTTTTTPAPTEPTEAPETTDEPTTPAPSTTAPWWKPGYPGGYPPSFPNPGQGTLYPYPPGQNPPVYPLPGNHGNNLHYPQPIPPNFQPYPAPSNPNSQYFPQLPNNPVISAPPSYPPNFPNSQSYNQSWFNQMNGFPNNNQQVPGSTGNQNYFPPGSLPNQGGGVGNPIPGLVTNPFGPNPGQTPVGQNPQLGQNSGQNLLDQNSFITQGGPVGGTPGIPFRPGSGQQQSIQGSLGPLQQPNLQGGQGQRPPNPNLNFPQNQPGFRPQQRPDGNFQGSPNPGRPPPPIRSEEEAVSGEDNSLAEESPIMGRLNGTGLVLNQTEIANENYTGLPETIVDEANNTFHMFPYRFPIFVIPFDSYDSENTTLNTGPGNL